MRPSTSALLLLFLSSGLFLLSSTTGTAQEPVLLQEQRYGGEFWEKTWGGTSTSDGGLILTGYTESFAANQADLYIVKVDGNGDTVWTRIYGGLGNDEGYAVAETPDKGFVVAGQQSPLSSEKELAWLLRTDQFGDTLWTRILDSTDFSYVINAARILDDGNILLIGGLFPDVEGTSQGWQTLIDANGKTLWSRSYPTEFDSEFFALDITPEGDFLLAGYVDPVRSDPSNGWLVRTNNEGDLIWQHNYGGDSSESFSTVLATANGDIICTGNTSSFGQGASDFWFLRLSSQGDSLLDAVHGGPGIDYASGVALTADNGIVIAGGTESFGAGSFDAWVLRLNSSGEARWATTLGGTSFDEAVGVTVTSDNGYMIYGSTESGQAKVSDMWFARLSSDPVTSVDLEHGNTEVLAGISQIREIQPNPLHTSTVIKWYQHQPGDVTVTVVDALGTPVQVWNVEGLHTGTHSVQWNGEGVNEIALPSGNYFCRIHVNGKVIGSAPLVLLR